MVVERRDPEKSRSIARRWGVLPAAWVTTARWNLCHLRCKWLCDSGFLGVA